MTPDKNPVNLGNAIKLIRTARGITQRQLAKRLKVTPNYISLVESGRREPSLSLLNDLADALKVPVVMLFMWQGHPKPGVKARVVDRLREMMLELDRLIVEGNRS